MFCNFFFLWLKINQLKPNLIPAEFLDLRSLKSKVGSSQRKRKIEIEFNFARENIPKPLLSSTCKSSSVLSKPFTQKKKAYLEPILCMLRLFNLKANS